MVGGPPSSSHGPGNGRTTVPSTQETGSQPHAINLNNNVLNPAAADQNTSSMLEVGGYFNTDLLPPATLNNYILLDFCIREKRFDGGLEKKLVKGRRSGVAVL
ncbi:hypothetical protein NC652_000261 [Populus alba x Populus x berolinensis]|uniref:Uncharacterized protein n=2 Tax=Populus TaxID=3689 RepID=A0ACC4CWH5_POPAL|nr:hypothetical protein NC652_000261 [Populus alba x Populus x berolinensis]KAJ7009338.1 hypothetical protein NC653_000105 [Populus alba x Populus x berolinensis]KAJ7009523.1 hypothetical protein NC653_000270 [Populus alba x Populus x berolinensis]KAJ7009528.1 hypothetical protein NC653_000275 [Populus alba x Populus x berolinensis]